MASSLPKWKWWLFQLFFCLFVHSMRFHIVLDVLIILSFRLGFMVTWVFGSTTTSHFLCRFCYNFALILFAWACVCVCLWWKYCVFTSFLRVSANMFSLLSLLYSENCCTWIVIPRQKHTSYVVIQQFANMKIYINIRSTLTTTAGNDGIKGKKKIMDIRNNKNVETENSCWPTASNKRNKWPYKNQNKK